MVPDPSTTARSEVGQASVVSTGPAGPPFDGGYGGDSRLDGVGSTRRMAVKLPLTRVRRQPSLAKWIGWPFVTRTVLLLGWLGVVDGNPIRPEPSAGPGGHGVEPAC